MGGAIQTFRELRVYLAACAVDEAIFIETKKWPREEMYSLTDQIRRSSRSVGANIAEAWAKRRFPAHFVSKLTDTGAELRETQHWLGRAVAYGYLKEAKGEELELSCRYIGEMLGKMIKAPDSFVPKP